MTISRHKTVVFVGVGPLLAFNYWLAVVRPRRMDCAPGEVCHVDSPAMRFKSRDLLGQRRHLRWRGDARLRSVMVTVACRRCCCGTQAMISTLGQRL
jgi:hypothetical protein